MARAMDSNSESDLNYLIDCMYFINGHCNLNDNCHYRHCREAVQQTKNCTKWPKTCRNITCPYRHGAITFQAVKKNQSQIPETLLTQSCQPQPQPQVLPITRQEGFISFFWDYENVPIPKGQKPFDIVQRVRKKLVVESGLQEAAFSCFCNTNTISQDNQQSLHHATVRIIHVPDRKPGAVDRQIMLELDRFERVHRPPATVVLISGDIDFVGKLSDLRHQVGFHVIVIHNKPAKEELKATVNAHYPWELFTQQQQQQQQKQQQSVKIPNQLDPTRIERPNRIRHTSSSNSLRRRDPSPGSSNRQVPIVNNQDIKKQKCPKCPSEFESVQNLQQHQNTKNHLFNCPVCNEIFFSLTSQIQHQKDKKHYVHDFKCNQCNRYFSKLESLNQHQQATGHISSSMQSTDNKEFALQTTSPTSLAFNNHDNNMNDQDPLIIILEGIEAIKQYYEKRALRND
ncbi:unnamed protein product [Rotaria sp. Silwood2]|nr:unnamed protein product [Rotaria sp. Silwood2]CAF4043369.1 unnamed protein product [Rotaria sp. Silwood2]